MEPDSHDYPRFTLRRLFLWMTYFACYFAIFSVLPATPFSLYVTSLMAVLVFIFDLKREMSFRGILGVSYFVCGLAYVVAVGLVTIQLFPPTAPPQPLVSFWSGLHHLISGEFLLDITREIAAAIVVILLYLLTIVACTIVSTAIALITVRHHRESRWLLFLNIPGILLCMYLLGIVIFETMVAN